MAGRCRQMVLDAGPSPEAEAVIRGADNVVNHVVRCWATVGAI